jgi:predicted RecB family nuclease
VKLAGLRTRVGKSTEKAAALLATGTPPDLILRKHCVECEFQSLCRQKAVEKDDLSLLAGMNEKERKRLNSKGIFTVTQLSYTFRPRRRPKRLRDKREKYHHSLKALAIREKKIHIVGNPELKIEGTPVHFDVEGLPDRDFYYLIGVRIGNGDAAIQHSLWADNPEDEKRIWTDFLAILTEIENPVLIHYGSYETTFLKRMCDRYGKRSVHHVFTDILPDLFQQPERGCDVAGLCMAGFLLGRCEFNCTSIHMGVITRFKGKARISRLQRRRLRGVGIGSGSYSRSEPIRREGLESGSHHN